MKSVFGRAKANVFFCMVMVCIQLLTISGCAIAEHIPGFEPVIDNDLVKEAVYDKITFKVGESWAPALGESGMYFYPGTNIVYYISCSGSFNDFVYEENYFDYVIQYLRDSKGLENVTVVEKMKSYKTADKRDAYISRLFFKESEGDLIIRHDADLLIIPELKYFVVFDVAYDEGSELPLDIRAVTDTAVFDFGPRNLLEGFTFYDENNNTLIQFTDSENFKTYLDPDDLDSYYSYGTYKVYMGEDAIKKVSRMEEYGLTREDVEFVVQGMLEQYSDIGAHFRGERVDEEDFMAIVFKTKEQVDETGEDNENLFGSLYIGFYIEEYDALVMVNVDSMNAGLWVKQEDTVESDD